MAFGFLRKKNYADSIFINANLVTEDEELKNCTWVAVKDEFILAIGEGDLYDSLKGRDTVVYDLEGRYLAPGFIDAFSDISAEIMKDMYVAVSPDASEDEILKTVCDHTAADPDAPYCLVYGAGMKLFNGKAEDSEAGESEDQDEQNGEEAEDADNTADASTDSSEEKTFTQKLDEASNGIPTIIMFEDGLSLRLNTAAANEVTERADELMVNTISPELALDTVVSADYIYQAKILMEKAMELASMGYTGIFSSAESGYFDKLTRDLMIDAASCDMIKQRIFAAYPLTRMFNPSSVLYSLNKAKTDCTELNGKINYVNLFLNATSDESSVHHMTGQYLAGLCSDAADKGYGVRLRAEDKDALMTAIEVLGDLSSQYKKLAFTVMHDEVLDDEERGSLFFGELNECPKNGTDLSGLSGEALFKALTSESAKLCGVSSVLGSLEEGKLADFAIFDEDPLTAPDVRKNGAYMTVLSGTPVYTRDSDTLENWVAVITDHLGSVAEFYEETESVE